MVTYCFWEAVRVKRSCFASGVNLLIDFNARKTVALRTHLWNKFCPAHPSVNDCCTLSLLFSQYFLQYLQPPALTTHIHTNTRAHAHTITPSVWRATFTKHQLGPVTRRSMRFFTKKTEGWKEINCFLSRVYQQLNWKKHTLTHWSEIQCKCSEANSKRNDQNIKRKKVGTMLDSLDDQFLLRNLFQKSLTAIQVKHQHVSTSQINATMFFFFQFQHDALWKETNSEQHVGKDIFEYSVATEARPGLVRFILECLQTKVFSVLEV